jgi:hypothetical protein
MSFEPFTNIAQFDGEPLDLPSVFDFLSQRLKDAEEAGERPPHATKITSDYVCAIQNQAKVKYIPEALKQVRDYAYGAGLPPYVVAQIINLAPPDQQKAEEWIPELTAFLESSDAHAQIRSRLEPVYDYLRSARTVSE